MTLPWMYRRRLNGLIVDQIDERDDPRSSVRVINGCPRNVASFFRHFGIVEQDQEAVLRAWHECGHMDLFTASLLSIAESGAQLSYLWELFALS